MSVLMPPVYILAAPFSGASFLAAALGRHPALRALPELHLFMAPSICELLEIFRVSQGPAADGLLRAVAQLCFGRQDDDTIAQARVWLAERTGWSTAAMLEALAQAGAGRRLVVPDVETPLRPNDLARLAQVPDLRCLHLVRHPFTQGTLLADHLEDRLFAPPDFKDHSFKPARMDPQIPWLRANQNLARWLAQRPAGSVLQVNFESIENEPEKALARICEWLGVAAGAAELAAMSRYRDWEFWGFGPPSAPYGLEAEALEEPPDEVATQAYAARLDAPLPWKPEAPGFAAEVRELAAGFGYR